MARECDILLVVNGIQTGFGRTGESCAFEHADIIPSAVTLSKTIGGSLSFSVVVYDESLDVWEPGAYVGTPRGNQLMMAAGIATIEHVLEHNLDNHTARMGERLHDRLDTTKHTHDTAEGVYSRGLILGIELVDPAGESDACERYPANPDLADVVRGTCFDRGLIFELGGHHGSVVRFLPPLIISPNDVDATGSVFADAAKAVIEDTGADGRREVAA